MNKKRSLKIVVEADSLNHAKPSGITHFTMSLLKELSRTHGTSTVAVVKNKKTIPASALNLANIKYRNVPLNYRVINYILTKSRLTIPADIFFGKGLYIFTNYKNWSLFNSNSVTFMHDLSFIKFPDTVEEDNRIYLSKHIRLWLNRTNNIACISDSTRKDFEKFFQEYADKLHTIHLGVDSEVYKKTVDLEILKKYSLPESYLLYLGNIEPRKNINILLDTYYDLYKIDHNIDPLVLVGSSGWLNEDTLMKIEELTLSGVPIYRTNKYVADHDLPCIISSAKVLIHPAIYEGFGLPILQAMACGTPVICSNTSSMPEVGGSAVEYFNPKSREQLEKKIKLVLRNETHRKRMSKAGLDRSKVFTWSNVVRRIFETADIK